MTGSPFVDMMLSGAFIFSADKDHKLLYTNEQLVRFFECEDTADLMKYVGGSFDGMIHDPEPEMINKEMESQLGGSSSGSGYVFFNIITKNGDVLRVVVHWTRTCDDDMGDVFYSVIYLHNLDNVSNDFDIITGLLGKRRFDKYATGVNKQYLSEHQSGSFALIFVNLVNFKRLNLESGIIEGNACLRSVAKVLGKSYRNAFVSRIAADHFVVFAEQEGVIENTENAIKTFGESYGNKYNVICKYGIYMFDAGPDFYVETAMSRAKIACDSIKDDDRCDYVVFSDELEESVKTSEYVVGKIDDAIKNGWIKVYFQPVIRSLTEKVCSMESLVRWIDPEIGFLPPDRFIGVLEKERCIHKLDSFVIDRVCSVIAERLDKGLPVVPASVNLSRLDFVMCDMLEVVENAVKKHGIPRKYLHIEITESMIASDEELMRKVINDFRNAGYEIWMDDFGSGYSSLTLLKEYDFNTLKLDMKFLTPLTEKSKSIIKSVITMAKDIGMKTLAEGVETAEQLEFLKEIGCGLIQGYYYGKPEPPTEVFEHLAQKGIDTELIEWSDFYQAASYVARATQVPLEVIEDDGSNFRTLFMNKAYKEQFFSDDFTLEQMDELIYKTSSPLLKKYREFADIAEASGKKETFYYTVNGDYISFTVHAIAEHDGHHILAATNTNLSRENVSDERARLDSMLKEMNLLFESVQAVNLTENTIYPLLGGFRYLDRDAVDGKDLQKSISYFAKNMVHPDETERCLAFLKSADLAKRVEATNLGYIADVFMIRNKKGYRPCETFIMMIPGTAGNEYLFCVKECVKRTQ